MQKCFHCGLGLHEPDEVVDHIQTVHLGRNLRHEINSPDKLPTGAALSNEKHGEITPRHNQNQSVQNLQGCWIEKTSEVPTAGIV